MERIGLNNAVFEGKNNVYLLNDGGETGLIDTGVPPSSSDLADGLAAQGLAFEDIETVLITHWHPDHSALSGRIQRAGGAGALSCGRRTPGAT